MAKPLVETKAKVGVFSIALQAYLPQFPQLVPEFEAQYEAFKKTLPSTIEIIDGGMVTTKEQSMAAGDKDYRWWHGNHQGAVDGCRRQVPCC